MWIYYLWIWFQITSKDLITVLVHQAHRLGISSGWDYKQFSTEKRIRKIGGGGGWASCLAKLFLVPIWLSKHVVSSSDNLPNLGSCCVTIGYTNIQYGIRNRRLFQLLTSLIDNEVTSHNSNVKFDWLTLCCRQPIKFNHNFLGQVCLGIWQDHRTKNKLPVATWGGGSSLEATDKIMFCALQFNETYR